MLNFPLGPVKVENCVCADAVAIAHIDADIIAAIEIVIGIRCFIYSSLVSNRNAASYPKQYALVSLYRQIK